MRGRLPDLTPFLRLYAGVRGRTLDRQKPGEVQQRQLLALVGAARQTRFGREHDFASIASVKEYQERVPIRRYEDFWAGWWEPAFPMLEDVTWPGRIPYFAASSGTTAGVTKYLPVSREMLRSNRKAALDLLVHHLRNRPRSRIFGGRNFMLGGSTEMKELAPGVLSGDLSGIAARELPLWARPLYFPPPDLALLADWQEKMDRIAPLSMQRDIRMIGGTASWLLMFLERLLEMRGGRARLADIWPNLEMVVHGGVNFAPYRRRYEALLDGSSADLREVYPASEGFLASADRGTGEGLRLVLDHGIFYEFVPVEELDAARPRRHWAADLETGVNYAVVMSTCAGAWSYVLGDTVRFVDRDPPRLLVTGRISWSLSAFGEHLIGEELEKAVVTAAAAIGREVTDWAVAPVYPQAAGERGHHLWFVEFSDEPPDAGRRQTFLRTLDRTLGELNVDYKDHRIPGVGIEPPRLLVLPEGAFADWMRRRGKLGGQNKVPRVVNDEGQVASLLEQAPGQGQPEPLVESS